MKIWLNDRKVKESEFAIPCHSCVFNRNVLYHQFRITCLLRTFNLRTDHDWCFKDMFMKIWRNDKRVVKSSQYMFCHDCALCGNELDDCFECLALLYGIHNSANVCLHGYKYETDV